MVSVSDGKGTRRVQADKIAADGDVAAAVQ